MCVCVCVYSCLNYQARKSNLSSVVLFYLCALSGSTILLPYYIINGIIFWKNVTEYKLRVLIFFTTLV